MKRIVLLIFLSACSLLSFAQPGKGKNKANVSGHTTTEKGERIELVSAQAVEGVIDSMATFKGSCIFKQGNMYLYCDSARQYQQSNRIEAYGHVRMVQGDTLTMTSDRLNYNGNTKKARATGNVHLKDPSMELHTDALDYDVNEGTAYYTNGAKINDAEYRLTSKIGIYNTKSKIFYFRKEVRVRNEKKKYEVDADTLEYQTTSKIVTFRGPSRISTPDGLVNADNGEYDMATGIMSVNGRSRVQRDNYVLEGKVIRYDEISQIGVAKGDVVMTFLKDSMQIYGQEARYNGQRGYSVVSGNPVLMQYSKGDTLYLRADTLEAFDPPKDSVNSRLKAFHHVRISRAGMLGRCDSLVYNRSDSLMFMYYSPILWMDGNQATGDTIMLRFKNGQAYALYLKQSAFIASKDSHGVYNQVSGRDMTAYLKKGQMDVVYVDGNGESIYYAIDKEKHKLVGLNYTLCSNIVIKFDSNNVSKISFLVKPESKFIPPPKITQEDKFLKQFVWREKEKPGPKAE
jgi:lipopolysaccharide export system protein LptA